MSVVARNPLHGTPRPLKRKTDNSNNVITVVIVQAVDQSSAVPPYQIVSILTLRRRDTRRITVRARLRTYTTQNIS